VLYGMIGLLGAKIWHENGVDFAKPVNLVPLAAGIILAIGNADLEITDDFSLSGIALGTIVAVAGYHIARVVAPPELRDEGALIVAGGPGAQHEDDVPPHLRGSGDHRG
jgi:xanthine/uracil permease